MNILTEKAFFFQVQQLPPRKISLDFWCDDNGHVTYGKGSMEPPQISLRSCISKKIRNILSRNSHTETDQLQCTNQLWINVSMWYQVWDFASVLQTLNSILWLIANYCVLVECMSSLLFFFQFSILYEMDVFSYNLSV